MLFIQTEGVLGSVGSTAIVLFIQTEGIIGCLHSVCFIRTEDVSVKKENKKSQVFERFHVERGFAQC